MVTAHVWLAGVVLPAGGWMKGFKFGLDGSKVGIEHFTQQTALRRAALLAAFGELVRFENGDLVVRLFVVRLDSVDILAHGVDLGLELQARSSSAQSCSGVI